MELLSPFVHMATVEEELEAAVVGDGEVAMVVEVGEAVEVAVVDAAVEVAVVEVAVVEVEDNSLCDVLPVILVLYFETKVVGCI